MLEIDGRADLYSLAATGYALLTGQPPFVEDDPVDTMERHLREAFPDVAVYADRAEGIAGVAGEGARWRRSDSSSAIDMLEAVERLLQMPADVVTQRRLIIHFAEAGGDRSGAQESVVELKPAWRRPGSSRIAARNCRRYALLYGLYAH